MLLRTSLWWGGGGGGNFIFEKEKKVMYIYTIKADSYM